MCHSWFKSFSLLQENLLEDNVVHFWNIAKRIQFDGKLQLLRFADTGAGNIKLTMAENGVDVNMFESFLLWFQVSVSPVDRLKYLKEKRVSNIQALLKSGIVH